MESPSKTFWIPDVSQPMPVTLKDIAQKVGKSVTTVSRALHDYDDVSPETKALVRQAADELGYIPNILAQRLQKQRTDTLGFILPTFGPRFSDPFFSEFLAGIGNKATELGYDILVATRPPGEKELRAYRDIVQSYRVDGFIIVRTRREDSRIQYLLETGFPFVAFGRTENTEAYPYVDEDGEYGMRLIVRHLARLGHRRIAFIGAPEDLMFAHCRKAGYLRGMEEAGLPIEASLLTTGDLTQRGGYEQALQLLNTSPPPTAIAASNDLMALGAINAARSLRMEVGRDIAITGFDDIPLAETSHPPLTTVHQPIYQIGHMVCEMLVGIITGAQPHPESVLLKPSLIVRQSCGVQGTT
ncbi:MAG: LacI family transcriptional regulator [Deltaproteobacteria bacterium]|nr:MAG: LacI family transcriptional regulator [Deltaproteobacteria bacterium]